MKKILLVSDYLDQIWWIETYIHDLAKILRENNFQVELFWVKWLSKTQKVLHLIKSISNKSLAKKFEKTLNQFKPDIIWFHSVSRVLWPEVVKKWVNFPATTIMTYHDLGYFAPFAEKIYNLNDIPENFTLKDFLKKNPKKPFCYPYVIFKFLKFKKT